MFTKLRNKFLLLNMSITSIVMAVAFAVIYFITYNNIQSDIQEQLSSGSQMQMTVQEDEVNEGPGKELGRTTTNYVSMDGQPSFVVEVDANGNVLSVNSPFNMEEDVYKKAARAAWADKKTARSIDLAGKRWRYSITPIRIHVLKENGEQYTMTDNRFQILFLDVTESKQTLIELLTTLLFVWLGMLVVIFAISLYFANRAIKPMAETWEKQKRFVADASHELKTPLSIINANFDLLMENKDETIASQLKWFSYIKVGTDRMTKLINDLLSLARLDNIDFTVLRVPFHISKETMEVISAFEAGVREKGIVLNCSVEPDLVAHGDAEKIKQVINILFENAIKYCDENGRIEISLSKLKRRVIFSISNSGKGIPKSDLPKVFERFYRANTSRTHENGSYGLGLSIAKTIIDGHGGEIWVESIENHHTTFRFSLKADEWLYKKG